MVGPIIEGFTTILVYKMTRNPKKSRDRGQKIVRIVVKLPASVLTFPCCEKKLVSACTARDFNARIGQNEALPKLGNSASAYPARLSDRRKGESRATRQARSAGFAVVAAILSGVG